jgi:hypothetical protein
MLFASDKTEIAAQVQRVKETLKLDQVSVLDAMTIITKMKSIFKEFNYLRKPDVEMDGRAAYFQPGPNENIVVISETAFTGMNKGDSRYLRILYEEIGHFYLGHRYVRNHIEVRSAAEKSMFQIQKDEAEAAFFAECFGKLR